ncbi:hypothetical protein DAEQUDRAFT_723729 [Daedalea quercina L-15889]|uniref:Uncharacterized protein n=1 Tax=Daedalea quercina L-15889 TaxID=1314783 RepID=A0A165S8P3_9APHY|nr:hypothetical protein DAEQUDRAFT_723729 [Daedalea quercina L-15889]
MEREVGWITSRLKRQSMPWRARRYHGGCRITLQSGGKRPKHSRSIGTAFPATVRASLLEEPRLEGTPSFLVNEAGHVGLDASSTDIELDELLPDLGQLTEGV